MSDPRRLLEDPAELSEEELRLLTAGANVEPSSALGAEVWAGLAAKLPPASGGSAPHGPGGGSPAPGTGGGVAAAQGAGASALLVKAGLALIAVGALLFAGRALLRSDVASISPAVQVPALARSAAPVAPASTPAEPQLEPATPPPPAAPSAAPLHPANAAHPSKAPSAPAPVAPSSSGSDASEESRVVGAARDALRSGNPGAALALLSEAQRRFGGGVLGQEREALSIEALAKSGQRALARTRGEAFLNNYAHSPYAARIRTLIGAN
jgi:hypothetical protein